LFNPLTNRGAQNDRTNKSQAKFNETQNHNGVKLSINNF
jgi:hypothetical protein